MSRPGSVEREPSQCPIDPEGEKFQTLVELVLSRYPAGNYERKEFFIANTDFFQELGTASVRGRFSFYFSGLGVHREYFPYPPRLYLPGRGRRLRKATLPADACWVAVDFTPLDKDDFSPDDLTWILASAYLGWKVFFQRLDRFLAEQELPPDPNLYFFGHTNGRMAKFAQRFGFQEGRVIEPGFKVPGELLDFPLSRWNRRFKSGRTDSAELDRLEVNVFAPLAVVRQAIAACEGPLVDQLIRRLNSDRR